MRSVRDVGLTVLLAGAGVMLVVAAVAAAPGMHAQATLEVDASVEDRAVTNGTITTLVVKVTNTGEESVTPVFRVWAADWGIQSTWHTTGPGTLAPGDTAIYTLQPPGEPAAPGVHDHFLIRIADSGEQSWVILRPSGGARR